MLSTLPVSSQDCLKDLNEATITVEGYTTVLDCFKLGFVLEQVNMHLWVGFPLDKETIVELVPQETVRVTIEVDHG